MNDTEPNIYEFAVHIDIHRRYEGKVFVIWPCDDAVLRQFVSDSLNLNPPDSRDNVWSGKCHFSQELDDKFGQPSVVMAFQNWDINVKDPQRWESNSHILALLAHECFHAAE